jgi:hypothetical protein
LAVEVSARNVSTKHRGHSKALGSELPWILLNQWSIYHCL